ncbi:MAG: flagellin [Candidatus Marinimicrobia bacterium]|nr:flagellin [Candidatus Neomarinimicrobiota bacterium]MCF7841115.1 flagellin [Candidatus Neomarinimicrobiota bacterium]MCF7901795.1 flagellin [Candidatus Neomarinimicrobiota bacterium]
MGDLTRIFTNVRALQSLSSMQDINNKIGVHQMRLSTGKKINSAADDPAGYQLARGLESRSRGLNVALQNVSNAKNVLNVAEGGYQSIMDILQTVKEKATQAADYTLSDDQRTALNDQVTALIEEVDDIVTNTTFNGKALIDGSVSSNDFQVGEGANDTLSVTLGDSDSAALSINSVAISTQASASAAISSLSSAIDTLAASMQDVGNYQSRLSSKETTLQLAATNTEAVRSSIEDADFAEEQMEVMKLQILQQTALSSFAQANTAPQSVLSLFQ